jgi:hypothetical protein
MENRKFGIIVTTAGIATIAGGVVWFILCMIIAKIPVGYPESIAVAWTWGFVYPIFTIPVFIIGGILVWAGREKYRP